MAQAANTLDEDLYSKPQFVYHPSTDTYHCPAGQLLARYQRDTGKQTDYYGTRASGSCALKSQLHQQPAPQHRAFLVCARG